MVVHSEHQKQRSRRRQDSCRGACAVLRCACNHCRRCGKQRHRCRERGLRHKDRTTKELIFSEDFRLGNDRSCPVSVSDIVIPTNFDATYDTYNNIQLAQGLDLSKYKGKKAVKYTYKVTNYPDNAETVNANLIVVDETIIAGDVSSTSLGGFMHGFAKPASVLAREAEAQTTTVPNLDIEGGGK